MSTPVPRTYYTVSLWISFSVQFRSANRVIQTVYRFIDNSVHTYGCGSNVFPIDLCDVSGDSVVSPFFLDIVSAEIDTMRRKFYEIKSMNSQRKRKPNECRKNTGYDVCGGEKQCDSKWKKYFMVINTRLCHIINHSI